MGLLLNNKNSKITILKVNHSVGRSIHNNLIIPEPDISKSHSSIYWFKNQWYVKDNSSNGTLLNGELLIHESRKIKKGDVLQFGKNKNSQYTFKADHFPSSYLNNVLTNDVIVLKNGAHHPNEEPVVSFFKLNDSDWVIDDGEKEQPMFNGKIYNFCDQEWVFVTNEPIEDTLIYQDTVPKLLFEFIPNHDQENIKLIISNQNIKYDLGERVHNHLLFLLAKEKIKDIENKIQQNLSGWISMDSIVDVLKKELGQPNIDQYYVNIMIHRIRKQLSKDLPFTSNLSDLIERNNGKLRFRYDNISISI